MSVCVRYIGDQLPLHELAFFRSIVAVVIVVILMLQRGEVFFPAPRKPLILRGVLGTIGLVCLFHATANLPLSISGILVWCTPAVTYITARILLGERLGIKTSLWLVVAFMGLFSIFAPFWLFELRQTSALAQMNFIDFSIGLVGTLFAGLVYVTVRSAAADHTNNNIILSFSLVASIATGIWLCFSYETPSREFLILLLILGAAGTLAQFALTESYRNAPASLVSSMSLLQAPFAILWGLLLFNEQLTFFHLFGIFLMGAGVLMASRAHANTM